MSFQVSSFEEAADEDEEVYMMSVKAIKELMQLAGIGKRGPRKQGGRTRAPASANARMKKAVFTKACTTELVGEVMDRYFRDQLAGTFGKEEEPTKGKKKAKKDASDDEDEDEDGEEKENTSGGRRRKPADNKSERRRRYSSGNTDDKVAKPSKKIRGYSGIDWVDKEKPKGKADGKTFYEKVRIGEDVYVAGDCALVYYQDADGVDVDTYVRRIEHLFQDQKGNKMAHVSWFEKGSETVLGDTASDREVFQVRTCTNMPLENVISRADVVLWETPANWGEIGGTKEASEAKPPIDEEDKTSFFCRSVYTNSCARFEQFIDWNQKEGEELKMDSCYMCPHTNAEKNKTLLEPMGITTEAHNGREKVDIDEEKQTDAKGQFHFKHLTTRGTKLSIGDAVFLRPDSKEKEKEGAGAKRIRKQMEEDKYPEYYRYKSAHVKGSNEKCPKPFQLGIIVDIYSKDKAGRMRPQFRYRKLYRPEDTGLKPEQVFAKDLNLVYWSADFGTADLNRIEGKAYVRAEPALNSTPSQWTKEGQHRFYFNEVYDKTKKDEKDRFDKALPQEAEMYGMRSKGKGGKGKGDAAKGKSASSSGSGDNGALPSIPHKLATLDVFSGCGGLSHGLHESGVAESRWAIEVYEPAAKAFKANNPDCTVFTDDCNLLLDKAMKGETHNDRGQKLPVKGEVELLVGGPPCQGFSGMNRFNHGTYSAFKNSLVATYLSYCDYYRPKYFILENVRNFATHKKAVVLKLCLASLLRMGYNCTFGILQAGHFGVAQTRRRTILLAAAPGYKLPLLPEPLHVFAGTSLSATIDDEPYDFSFQCLLARLDDYKLFPPFPQVREQRGVEGERPLPHRDRPRLHVRLAHDRAEAALQPLRARRGDDRLRPGADQRLPAPHEEERGRQRAARPHVQEDVRAGREEDGVHPAQRAGRRLEELA